MTELMDLTEYTERAESWLGDHAERRPPDTEPGWGIGSDNVAVFHNLNPAEERACVDELRAWQRLKSEAGYGSITWPVEYGGAGLPPAFEAAFSRLERGFLTPAPHEAVTISLNIEAPTILTLGTEAQKRRWVASLRRADELCCQLFSEPAAGSDLGSIAMRAERDGDVWVLNGQKVWTSGAQFADVGYAIARTDPTGPRQTSMTAFLVDLRSPGVEVRPLRQMSGGSSFNEVFLTDVRVPDTDRVGEVGSGWHAMMTTLGFERSAATGGSGGTDLFGRLVMLARHLGRDHDPIVRQLLAEVYTERRVAGLNRRRAAARLRADGVPGPEGSLGKLAYSTWLQRCGHVAAVLLGPRLTADTGEWGTFAWSELVNGAPGMRIGGGTDEIQRNTIAERVLGLPREPR
ncbi:MAG: acyl-CoA dehydrogenase family protein [Acidimicrobiales bacterium]